MRGRTVSVEARVLLARLIRARVGDVSKIRYVKRRPYDFRGQLVFICDDSSDLNRVQFGASPSVVALVEQRLRDLGLSVVGRVDATTNGG
jgi:hypothetical protein